VDLVKERASAVYFFLFFLVAICFPIAWSATGKEIKECNHALECMYKKVKRRVVWSVYEKEVWSSHGNDLIF